MESGLCRFCNGIGFEGGQTLTDDGTLKSDKTPVAIVSGRQHQGPVPEAPDKKALIEGEHEQNPEGLKLDVLDSDKKSMFSKGTQISPFGKTILNKLAELIMKMPNHVSITGHTDAQPFNSASGNKNWDLSTGRANAARRYLMTRRIKDERVSKVIGRADRELIVPDVPDSPRNRRITIILLRGSHLFIPLEQRAAPRSLLSVPRVNRLTTDEGLAEPQKVKEVEKETIIKNDGTEILIESSPAPQELQDEGF